MLIENNSRKKNENKRPKRAPKALQTQHFEEGVDIVLLGEVLDVWNYFRTFQDLLGVPEFTKEDLWTAVVFPQMTLASTGLFELSFE